MTAIGEVTSLPEETSTIEERKQRVARTWLTEHHGRPVRLRPEDVREVAFRLLAARVQPTVEAIRQVNGGSGSPNAIHPALRDFFATGELEHRWRELPVTPDLPKPLVTLWNDALADARQVAWAELSKDREAAAEAVQELDRERADFAEQKRVLKATGDAQAALVARLQQESGALREQIGRLKAEVARSLEERDDARCSALADRKAVVEVKVAQRALEARNGVLQEQLDTFNNTLQAIAEERRARPARHDDV